MTSALATATYRAYGGRKLLSVVTPAYNEHQNLPVLYQRLCAALIRLDVDWEWIVIDDHSQDATFMVLSELSTRDPRVRGLRFSRNFGSHAALSCALTHARGDSAVIIAADLQDPPEVIPTLVERWNGGAQVVWATRERRAGEKASTIGLSRLYYFIMRNVVGMREIAETGADFFLIDRKAIDAYLSFSERNVSLFALIAWLGFRQETIGYTKEARLHGKSGWTAAKKIKLAIDSVTAFSFLPIRLMSWLGVLTAFAGFTYAALIIYNAFVGQPAEGWSSLMVAVMVIGGLQMLMMGILGEYLWRALDEARRRPRYTVEATTPDGVTARAESPEQECREVLSS
jgi:glycosyltransferase involved in cell wall biosynthesis